ncbi:PAS domain S-box protein [Mucilaginibacter limnophilus]|uniref:histidine kinase n=1 Tax=Mucilaginibacter limnophilus TaxID=1932778 RepID=A0A3S2UQC4_9SPHI|nr:PAS domain S-box protein [Mucilaginibacter limnophilus]RVU01890.1 PAS domain S-box protein [Mucilaginibacter limnophilus]
MIKENTPQNTEAERLAALDSYAILDTLPEKEYDAITKLASYICRAPIALITLVDEKRQWFKSVVGIDGDGTPRADAFCNYTIQSDNILEVNNATQDDRFKNNPFVTGDPNIRFYAGAPIVDPEGHRLGSLCVIDRVPRQLDEQQREALSTLAGEVMSHLTLRKQKMELEASVRIHEEFFDLFNTSPEVHCIMDKDFRVELINKAVTNVLGYSPEEVTGHVIWEFFSEESRNVSLERLKSGNIRSQDIETQLINKKGEKLWISWSLSFKENKWYASGRDVTEHKRLHVELEQLSLVASKVSNGVVISDANDKVVWVNDAFEDITGFNLKDVEGNRLRNIILKNPETNPDILRLNELISKKKSYEIDLLMTKKEGEPLWIKIINSFIFKADGEIDKYIRVIININQRKRAEQDLEILSFAARKSPGGIIIRDAEGRVVWMNEVMEDIIGYTLAEMEGKTFGTMLLGEDTDMSVFEKALKAVAENRPYDVEIKIYKKDGTPKWVWITNSPLFNEVGTVERQVGVMVDITERKKVEQQLKMLSLVASSTTGGVIINDSEGNVEWINSGFEKITGYSIDDIKGKHLGDVVKGELTDFSIIERTRELSKNKQSFEVDLLIYRKDGQPLWISVINSVILDDTGKVDKYIEVIIDITAKKKVELELIAAKEEAIQLNRAKDMFISVLSHEMRTPLNAVIGMSHLLIEENPLESQKENLNILKFSAENLLTLINDVLDFTKIETGNIELEKANVDTREMIQSVIASLKYKVQEKNIYLKANLDPSLPQVILADRTRLCQILLNLVSNAVKFTNEGGVTIDIKVIEQSAKKVRIRFAVADTGIGIANDKINTIFEAFKQAEADTTRKYGGTGLGLPISKRLIELHDSRINVDSVVGQGSTFWFTISFEKAESQINNNNSTVEAELNINVLVVDDNQINRLLVNKVLKKWGATADFAENGREAVEKIEANLNYDAVLMDIHMPEMGGLEATQIIRSKSESYFQQLPIIALTASMLNTEINQITHAGMNDYLLKPFDPKTLYTKLSRYQKQ